MAENNDKQQSTNTGVVDHRAAPPGLMRKSLQSWAMLVLALLILLLIWVTGGGKSTTPAAQSQQQTKTVEGTAPDADLAQRLQEQARQQQQNAVAQPSAAGTGDAQTPNATASAQPVEVPPEPDPIEVDKKKREYTSLFSSSVALSYREPEGKPASPVPQQPTPEELAAAIANMPVPAPNPGASAEADTLDNPLALLGPLAQAPANPAQTQPQAERRKTAVPANPNEAIGKDYTVFEGTLLEAVLINRLDGDFNGPIICMLTNDVYSKDRLHLLIPAGSKLVGETKQVDSFGQRRLAVSFHRLIMPDGYSLDLDKFQGLNQIGETGLKDKINHHYMQIFGASIAVGAIAGLAQLGTQNSAVGVSASPSDVYRQGVASSLAQSSLHILDQFLNVLPTITIREGHRVKVYLTQDLLAPDYAQHAMPTNL